MAGEQAHELRERGIEAAKAGEREDARRLLQQSLRLEPHNDTAWLWLASVARDKRERLLCLKKVLELDHSNETARKAVEALGVDPDQLAPPPPSIADSLADEDEVAQGPGVPMPDPELLREVQEQAEEITRSLLTVDEPAAVSWVRKTRRRAGEREAFLLRMQVIAAVMTFLVIIVGGAGLFIANSPEAQLVLFGPSPSPVPPTHTPTNTPTNTPGITPTPSPTRDFTNEPTFTPSPTIFPSITPGRIEITPAPTQPYAIQPMEPEVRRSDELLNAGQAEEALPLLATVRAQQAIVFGPNPYYYGALAYAQLENYNAAVDLLDDATGRMERLEGVRQEDVFLYQPLIHVGYAQVYLQQAQAAIESASMTGVNDLLAEARERAQAALTVDNRIGPAHLALAESYRLAGNYAEAQNVLAQAQTVPALVTDVNLIVARGRTYLEQGLRAPAAAAREAFENAAHQAFYAVYINPFNEAAQQLRVETALALDDPGLAVLYSLEYLFYVPESAQAFRLLGDARVAEGNNDLALEAYTRSLESTGPDTVIAQALVSRALLYNEQRRYDLARDDLTAAIALRDLPSTRALRLRAAYAAGDYDIAREDADLLLGSGVLPDNEIRLIQARILIDEAGPNDRPRYNDALALFEQIGGNIPAEEIHVINEYRARAHYVLGNLGDALNAVNLALNAVETGSRRYLRGQIHQAREEFDSAIAEYEWVLRWDQVYAYPFADEAAQNIIEIREIIARRQAEATATAQTATAEVEYATATAEAEATATAITATAAAEQATASAEAEATAAAEQATETAEAEVTATAETEATATAEALVTPSATPTPEPEEDEDDG